MSYNILLVEDEAGIAEGIMDYMKESAITFTWAADGDEALALVYEHEYDLALLDVMLPGADGFEICRAIRAKSYVPIIFLTARGREEDRLYGYDLGCDDYVVKPFSMKVLLKRIEVAFRRNRGEDAGEQILKCRNLTLYPQRKKAVSGENEIALTAKEYQLLEYLMKNQGQVLTKENILEHVWGIDGQYVVDNSVSVLVGRLRKKIEAAGERPYIQNVFGLGYRMEEE